MNEQEIKLTEKIRNGYQERQKSKLDELTALDKKAKRPATVFAYTFGSIGSLVLGTGMSLAMGAISGGMVLGVGVGVVGLAMVSVNYLLYKAFLSQSRKKYASRILALSDELLRA